MTSPQPGFGRVFLCLDWGEWLTGWLNCVYRVWRYLTGDSPVLVIILAGDSAEPVNRRSHGVTNGANGWAKGKPPIVGPGTSRFRRWWDGGCGGSDQAGLATVTRS